MIVPLTLSIVSLIRIKVLGLNGLLNQTHFVMLEFYIMCLRKVCGHRFCTTWWFMQLWVVEKK